jgi:tripartite-type tricarboxylate transporter receptor subunit TctC
MAASIQHIKSGMLRALAVTTGTRSDALPDVPAMAESVPGYEASVWYGIGAPKDTPADVIGKLNKEINAAAADPATTARVASIGADPMAMTSAEFGKFMVAETEKWGKAIRAANIKAE